jgi:hypothetical protein
VVITWQQPYAADGNWYILAHGVDAKHYERLRHHQVFGRIDPFYQSATGFISGCFPNALTQADADNSLRFLQADFPAYGVVELSDYLEDCIVNALLAGLVDTSTDDDDIDDGWRGDAGAVA